MYFTHSFFYQEDFKENKSPFAKNYESLKHHSINANLGFNLAKNIEQDDYQASFSTFVIFEKRIYGRTLENKASFVDFPITFIQKYKLKDDRIVLIKNKVNLGKGDIRNLGINNSNGEYIGFIDSDDTIEERYFEELYNTAKKYDSDIVCTNNIKKVKEGFVKDDKINDSKFESGVLNYDASIFIESMRNHFIMNIINKFTHKTVRTYPRTKYSATKYKIKK